MAIGIRITLGRPDHLRVVVTGNTTELAPALRAAGYRVSKWGWSREYSRKSSLPDVLEDLHQHLEHRVAAVVTLPDGRGGIVELGGGAPAEN